MRESTHGPKPPTMKTRVVLSPVTCEPLFTAYAINNASRHCSCSSEKMDAPLTALFGPGLSPRRRYLSSCA